MAIQFRSTPKRTQRDTSVDAILSRQDFEDAVAAVNMTLAEIAKQTGVNRQYLSEFKSGDRNLRAEMRQTLRDFFESKGVEFVAADADMEDSSLDVEPATRPTQVASRNTAVLPTPTFLTVVGDSLPEAERKATQDELSKVVQENNLRLSTVLSYHFAFQDSLNSESEDLHEELRKGLADEAVLRRVLAGTFKARHAEGKAATHADLIAQQCLANLPDAASAADPEPIADSSDEDSVADAASAGAAMGEGPSVKKSALNLFA